MSLTFPVDEKLKDGSRVQLVWLMSEIGKGQIYSIARPMAEAGLFTGAILEES
jgi:hypothetical protein